MQDWMSTDTECGTTQWDKDLNHGTMWLSHYNSSRLEFPWPDCMWNNPQAQWDHREDKAWEHGGTMWDTPVPWLCLHWSVQASGGREERSRKVMHQSFYLPSASYHVCDHVRYLSDAHVKVLVVHSAGDRLRPVELGLLRRRFWRLDTLWITGHFRWNLQPWWQIYCPCPTVLFRLRNIKSYLNCTSLVSKLASSNSRAGYWSVSKISIK